MNPEAKRQAGSGVLASVERLYHHVLVASIVFGLLLFLLAALVAGQLRKQASVIAKQQAAVEQLAARVEQVESLAARGEAPRSTSPTAGDRDAAAIPQPNLAPSPTLPGAQPSVAPERESLEKAIDVRSSTDAEPLAPSEAVEDKDSPAAHADDALAAEIDAYLANDEQAATGPAAEAARVAAAQLLAKGGEPASHPKRSGQLWARLAYLARVADQPGQAEILAVRARQAGVFPEQYLVQSLKNALDNARVNEAGTYARRLLEQQALSTSARLTLAEWQRAVGDRAAAEAGFDSVVPEINNARLALRCALLAIWLERWPEFAALAEQGLPPGTVLPQRDGLLVHAVRYVRAGQYVEALATLDNLLESHASDFDATLWRGVALLEAGQPTAARAALQACQAVPSRPEGWHWAGVLEMRSGERESGELLLQKAIAASTRYAPAWEALGHAALEAARSSEPELVERERSAAIESLRKAAEFAPRRASAHWLLAQAHVEAGNADEAKASLRRAIAIDRNYLDQAKAAISILRLIPREEVEQLASSPN